MVQINRFTENTFKPSSQTIVSMDNNDSLPYYPGINDVNIVSNAVQITDLVADIIKNEGPFPPYSLLMGACSDGYHLLMDLKDSHPGSILISGSSQFAKVHLLHFILASACLLNSPDQARINIISKDPASWFDLIEYPHISSNEPPYFNESISLVITLCELVEKRRHGRNVGPAIILAIDDLTDFTNNLDGNTYIYFRWLLKEGAKSRVWTIATMDKSVSKISDHQLISLFRTRIYEETNIPPQNEIGDGWSPAENLSNGEFTFGVNKGERRLHFRIPRLVDYY